VRGHLTGHFPSSFAYKVGARAGHPNHRQAYNAQPSLRPMGAGLEPYGLSKDGSEYPVAIMLSPVETAEGRVIVIRDISERKKRKKLFDTANSNSARSSNSQPIQTARASRRHCE
jgi:hypothetical protein